MNDKRLVLLNEHDILMLKNLRDWLPQLLVDVEKNSIYLSEITLKMIEAPKEK